ncbi:MAG: hypothetical protein IPP41_03195 [Rhodocyclaceae bacterium]|nr:hypothetical protein [Rhodocyclaceae bacterium]
MLTAKQLSSANVYGEWLRLAVHEKSLPANNRVRAAGSCLGIAQDHHHAIIVLLGARLYASCFALLRVAFEAYVRGEWLALCATDTQIRKFMKGWEPPKIDDLLEALSQKTRFRGTTFSDQETQLEDAVWIYPYWRRPCPAVEHVGWNPSQLLRSRSP